VPIPESRPNDRVFPLLGPDARQRAVGGGEVAERLFGEEGELLDGGGGGHRIDHELGDTRTELDRLQPEMHQIEELASVEGRFGRSQSFVSPPVAVEPHLEQELGESLAAGGELVEQWVKEALDEKVQPRDILLRIVEDDTLGDRLSLGERAER
jgi:hypothetical protein